MPLPIKDDDVDDYFEGDECYNLKDEDERTLKHFCLNRLRRIDNKFKCMNQKCTPLSSKWKISSIQ